ncbi:SRPBCC family protein [Phytohabitans sp. ZYX-F-186]|uniref:SRPBCC family protein n=1 Tax=Phytohabitans maris TaxID=3071409 RepID=A0ABU0ZRF3_9ACTN|nr:SRPBCC family protein [Phytohabitans sp. ZYX-F-186]MDQ7909548.1 SRPBCC family protein [Phytohabitans sp. ZYX-F-186]
MTDTAGWLKTVHRELGAEDTDAGRSRSVLLRRSFGAPVEDVWEAVTDPVRLERWFYPVSGDLRLGGKYQLVGNAGGEIRTCDRPNLLVVTWEYDGGGSSDLEVRLTAEGDGEESTLIELRHTAVLPFDDDFWLANLGQFAPGWDHGFCRLDAYLRGELAEGDSPNELSIEAQRLWELAGAEWAAVGIAWRES